MRYLLGGALAIVAALALVFSNIPSAEPVPPPSAEVQAWVEKCIDPKNNCDGDVVFFQDGDRVVTRLFYNWKAGRLITNMDAERLAILVAHDKTGRIRNVVTTNDPDWPDAARFYFNRTNK